jgi:hypothetical protein
MKSSLSCIGLAFAILLFNSCAGTSPKGKATGNSPTPLKVLSINSADQKEFERKLRDIDQWLGDSGIGDSVKLTLSVLRNKTVAAAKLHEECRTFDVNSLPNKHCQEFFGKTLGAFADTFDLVMGDLFLSRLSQIDGQKDRMEQIRTCVSALGAFVNPSALRQNLVRPRVIRSTLEPISDEQGDFFYRFEIRTDSVRIARLVDLADWWNATCGPVVKHPVSNQFAPYFLNALPDAFGKSGFVVSTDSGQLLIQNSGFFHYGYSLNGKPLIQEPVDPLFVDGGKSYLEVSMEPAGARAKIVLRGDSVKVFEGSMRIPIKDASEIKVAWSVDSASTPKATKVAPPIQKVVPVQVAVPVQVDPPAKTTPPVQTAPPATVAPTAPVSPPPQVVPPARVVPKDAIPKIQTSAPLSKKRKVAMVLWGSSLAGFGSSVYFNSQVNSSIQNYNVAETSRDAQGLQTAYDDWNAASGLRTASYSYSLSAIVLGCALWFWPEGGK